MSNDIKQNPYSYPNLIKRMIPYVRPYWFRAVLALELAIPIGCLDAVIALSLKPYMDVVMIEKMFSPDGTFRY